MSASAHGHTPAAWTGVTIAFIGFCVAGGAVVMTNLPLMWAGFGVVLLGGVVGKAMQMAGMGKTPPNAPLRAQAPAGGSASPSGGDREHADEERSAGESRDESSVR
ncbi:HGxxPAAW family protein [Wenjunlia vitaminophila]|uniref:HGxxPAAW family protein n=1 Tax=Wenjunlia vitaminophila TaxID=76728 RepID=UPI00039E25A1